MQEHIYKFDSKRAFNQSFLIAFCNVSYLGILIFAIVKMIDSKSSWYVLLIWSSIGLISVPGIFLFFNYLKYSANKELKLFHECVKLVDSKTLEEIKIEKKDIQRIELHQNYSDSKLPWFNYEYFSIVDKDNKKIIVTSFIMNISELWLDSLTIGISSDKLIKSNEIFPSIKS